MIINKKFCIIILLFIVLELLNTIFAYAVQFNDYLDLFTPGINQYEDYWNQSLGGTFSTTGYGFDQITDLFQIGNENFYFVPVSKDCIGTSFFRIGYNEKYKEYSNLGYMYSLDTSNQNYGILNTKFTELNGNEYSIKHYSEINPDNRFVYGLTVGDHQSLGYPNNDFKYLIGYQNNNPALTYNVFYQKWNLYANTGEGRFFNEYNLNINDEYAYSNLKLAYQETPYNDDVLQLQRTQDYSGNWCYTGDPSLQIQVSGRSLITENPVEETNRNKYDFNVSKNWDWIKLSLNYNKTEVNNENEPIINKIPEITCNIPQWNAPLIGDISLTSQYTKLENTNASLYNVSMAERYSYDMEKEIILWQGGSLQLKNKDDYYYRSYNIDNSFSEVSVAKCEFGLQNQFTGIFSIYVGFGDNWISGTPNSFFGYLGYNDNFIKATYLTHRWNWIGSNYKVYATTQYSYGTQEVTPLEINGNWSLDETHNINFQTWYKWCQGFQIAKLDSYYNLDQNNYWNIHCEYDFLNSTWLSRVFQVKIGQPIFNTWQINVEVLFDSLVNKFSVGKVGISSGGSCPTVQIYYDGACREYWVQFILKNI